MFDQHRSDRAGNRSDVDAVLLANFTLYDFSRRGVVEKRRGGKDATRGLLASGNESSIDWAGMLSSLLRGILFG